MGLLAKAFYRPLVYSHGWYDFGLAGVLPNFFWAMFNFFCFVFFMSPQKAFYATAIANILYEFDQLKPDGIEDLVIASSGRTFDPYDILATLAGVAISYLILKREIAFFSGNGVKD